jgi:hypothetical protein
MPRNKEAHYFDRYPPMTGESWWNQTKSKLSYYQYHRLFQFKSRGKKNNNDNNYNRVYGEATPIYMFVEQVPSRIAQYNPNMKWIIVLRDPILRSFR